MTYANTVKKSFIAEVCEGADAALRSGVKQVSKIVARRPVSHAAAATFLGTSVYVAHEGLMTALPPSLAWALTGLVVSVSTLQWLAHGRYDACIAEKDHDRADAVIHQAWMFGAIEAALFAFGTLALCARDGLHVWTGEAIAAALAGSALFAFCTFRVKWTSCDSVTVRKSTRSADAIFAPEPPPAARAPGLDPELSADDLGVIKLEDRIRMRDAQHAMDRKAQATAKKTAAERLERATGRIRTRHYRSQRKAAAA